jgi:hypothetical protein
MRDRGSRLPVLAAAAAVAALAVVAAPARAEAPDAPVAFGMNNPLGWLAGSIGASAYVRLGEHHALRGNLARYRYTEPLKVAAAISTGAEVAGYGGGITDLGASWVWYPRRLWSGVLIEAGALRRERVIAVDREERKVTTRSTTYAGRAMIGWSWLVTRRTFLAVAAGVSAGREDGRETITIRPVRPGDLPATSPIARLQIDGEAYLRLGCTLGD